MSILEDDDFDFEFGIEDGIKCLDCLDTGEMWDGAKEQMKFCNCEKGNKLKKEKVTSDSINTKKSP